MDGLLIQYHQTTCPNCGTVIEFTTIENTQSNQTPISRIKLKPSLSLNITEIDLGVNGQNLEMVYDMLYQQGLKNQSPAKVYKAIFMSFIEKIHEFSLGDWREIVKIVEPEQPITTKKAWDLYLEALERHKNRLLALSFIEQRKNQNQNSTTHKKVSSSSGSDQPGHQVLPDASQQTTSKDQVKKLGSPYFQKKYASQWQQSLANCSKLTADFLTSNTGLFHVETTPKHVNISLEVRDVPTLKSRLKEVFNNQEIQTAFTKGFGKVAQVMLRLAS